MKNDNIHSPYKNINYLLALAGGGLVLLACDLIFEFTAAGFLIMLASFFAV